MNKKINDFVYFLPPRNIDGGDRRPWQVIIVIPIQWDTMWELCSNANVTVVDDVRYGFRGWDMRWASRIINRPLGLMPHDIPWAKLEGVDIESSAEPALLQQMSTQTRQFYRPGHERLPWLSLAIFLAPSGAQGVSLSVRPSVRHKFI